MKVLVLGCGRVGAGVAHNLVLRRHDVVVIDHDESAFDRLEGDAVSDRIHGSALDREVLVRAGIERADAVAVVTGRDQVNAVVAHAAKVLFRVPIVIARLYDPRNAAIHERLGIRTVAPVTWGIRRIADLLTASPVEPVATLGVGDVQVVRVHVPHLLEERTAKELEVSDEIRVIAVTRGGRTFLADPSTLLAAGDLVDLAVVGSSVGRLERLLGQP